MALSGVYPLEILHHIKFTGPGTVRPTQRHMAMAVTTDLMHVYVYAVCTYICTLESFFENGLIRSEKVQQRVRECMYKYMLSSSCTVHMYTSIGRSSCADLLATPGRWDIDCCVYLALGSSSLCGRRGRCGRYVCVIASSAVNEWTVRVCWTVRVVFGRTGVRRIHAC